MAVPRAAAARATATSPSGCTAWTPVGRDEDRERDLLAHDLGGQVPAVGQAGHVRGEAQLAERGDVVLDRDAALGAGDQRAVDRLGQALLGPPLGLGHRLEPLVCHSEPLVLPVRPAPRRGHRRPGDSTRRAGPPHSGRPGEAPTLGSAACPSPNVRPARPPSRRRRAPPASAVPPSHYERYRPGPPVAAVEWILPATGADGRRPRRRHGRPDPAPGRAGRRGRGGRARRPHAGGARRVGPRRAGRGGPGRVDPAARRQRRRRARVVLVALDGHRSPRCSRSAGSWSPAARWARCGPGPTPSRPSSRRPRALLGGDGARPRHGRREPGRAVGGAERPVRAGAGLEIPPGVPFDQPEQTVFTWDVALNADELIGLLGTFSWVILMEDERPGAAPRDGAAAPRATRSACPAT